MIKQIFIIFIFLLISTVNSYAYLDPGTGSMIITAIAAAIASVATFISFYWNKLKNFLRKIKKTIKMKKKIQTNSFLFLIICTIPFLEYSISNIQELSYFLYIDLFIILISTINYITN